MALMALATGERLGGLGALVRTGALARLGHADGVSSVWVSEGSSGSR